jgi:hypothetical protein
VEVAVLSSYLGLGETSFYTYFFTFNSSLVELIQFNRF